MYFRKIPSVAQLTNIITISVYSSPIGICQIAATPGLYRLACLFNLFEADTGVNKNVGHIGQGVKDNHSNSRQHHCRLHNGIISL